MHKKCQSNTCRVIIINFSTNSQILGEKDQLLSIFTWAECWSEKNGSCIFIEMVNRIIVFV